MSETTATPDQTPRLVVSRWVTHTATGAQPRWRIAPFEERYGMGTCGLPGHFSAGVPTVERRRRPGLTRDLDCPCDVACPKCAAAPAAECQTPSGYPAKWHTQRVAASARCAGLLDGSLSHCDTDRHDWAFADPAGHPDSTLDDGPLAACRDCGRTEPIDTSPGAWRRAARAHLSATRSSSSGR